MLRSVNVLFIVVLVILLVVVFDPQARMEADLFWQGLGSAMEQLSTGLSVLFEQITSQGQELPAQEQERPPLDDTPVYNA